MLRHVVTASLALVLSAPLGTAFAQGGSEHALKIAEEVALRRAQVRALRKCEMAARPMTPADRRELGRVPARALPAYPPTGTGGPVRVTECPPDFFGTD
ncbi:MAG: hypothetical protein AB1918_02585 [Pseudomonadota bacterium]